MVDPRTEEIAARLAAVRARVADVCAEVGRDPVEVTVIAVTKTWPAAEVRRLAGLGVVDVGENRDQEAAGKAAACADLGLSWHFVGQLQTNKAASVVGYAAVVHSVDRARLVHALDRAATQAGRRLAVLLQVSLAGAGTSSEPGRGGAEPDGVLDLATAVAAAPGLELKGVMGVAPLGADPTPAFTLLGEVARDVRLAHPTASWISAGMTQDYPEAIRCGATHVRVGSALLGNRPPLR